MIKRPKQPSLGVGWYGPVDGKWMPLLDHFASLEVLDRQGATDWLGSPEPGRLLLIGLEHRSDRKLPWLLEMESRRDRNAPKSNPSSRTALKVSSRKLSVENPPMDWSRRNSIACVLGEDWEGHRRTFPLPERIETFYWHQWYDRVLPWVCWQGGGWQVVGEPGAQLGMRVGRIQADVDQFSAWNESPATQGLFGKRIAWVISDLDSGVELWRELLEAYGVRTVGTRADQLHVIVDADLVLIDFRARDGLAVGPGAIPLIAKLRRKCPDAFLIAVDPFARMDRWGLLRDQGGRRDR